MSVKATAETLEDPAHDMAMVAEAAAVVNVVADEKAATKDFAPLTPKPPTADAPLLTLMKAVAVEDEAVVPSEDVAPETVAAAVTPIPNKPQKAEVVVKVHKKKGPAASPLARLFAEELGIDLTYLGKGSGKNGKILIDDVRNFQSRLEAAKKSMTSNRGLAYFATAST
jgi:pyruvate/2-oxoglutarate dehydrogenase complex dihydrolipoamide acyltransferase (E2) component